MHACYYGFTIPNFLQHSSADVVCGEFLRSLLQVRCKNALYPPEPSGLWAADISWSHQAEILQKEILHSGVVLSADCVVKHLKHLRLANKQVYAQCISGQLYTLYIQCPVIITMSR